MLGDMPLPAKFFIAFVLVLALIGGVAWLVRRFGSGSLSASAGRGRQARLGVIEATAVDSRRRLVLVRRDNVEHLIMLGGPTDVVVEANIVRAQAAAGREAPPPRAPEPAGWQGQADAGWPAGAEPAYRPARSGERAIPPAVADDLPLQPYPEPAPREPAPRAPSGDRLAGLAAELARSGGGRADPQAPRPEPPLRRPVEARRAPAAPPRPTEEPHAGDEHLASMAQQLEAALRRPNQPATPRDGSVSEPRIAAPAARRTAEPREPRNSLIERAKQARSSASLAPPRARDIREAHEAEPPVAPPEPAADPAKEAVMADQTPPAVSAAPEPAAASSEPTVPGEPADQPTESKSPSLEEEMANLLGRSPGRP